MLRCRWRLAHLEQPAVSNEVNNKNHSSFCLRRTKLNYDTYLGELSPESLAPTFGQARSAHPEEEVDMIKVGRRALWPGPDMMPTDHGSLLSLDDQQLMLW